MKKTDIAALVAKDLKAEAKSDRRGEMQHIRAFNNGQHGEFKPLPKPTRNQLREAFKAQRLNWWRDLFNRRVTLDQAAGMLLGFSEVMAMDAKFVDAHKPKSKDPKEPPPKSRAPSRPVSSDLVTAFIDMRGDIADWRVTSDGKYRARDLIAWAKEKDCVADEVLAAWEAHNQPETGDAEQVGAAATAGSEMEIKPIQRGQAQDAAILETIKKMGHDPFQLPKNPAGKPGVKADVRKTLKDNPLFAGSKVFDKAWERLSQVGDIVIAKVSP
jgi:hypothetical protein